MKLALVQLGNPPKKYFWENLDHLRRLHPDGEIYVISDLKEVIFKAQEKGFRGYLYKTPEMLIELFSRHTYSKKFRNGFWQLSALRLFALIDFCESGEEKAVLHIEADVLLLPNFPFSMISIQQKLMWFNFNNDRDIASLIWIPSQQQATWMRNELFTIFSEDPTMTDMSALRKLGLKTHGEVCYFPSSSQSTAPGVERFRLESSTNSTSDKVEDRGIFDGASIGMWLTGEDPNNHRGVLRRLKHLSDGPIDLRGVKFQIIGSNLYLLDKDKFVPVYNLHIHSKNRILFTKYGKYILRFYVLLSNKKWNFPIFVPQIFLQLTLNKIRNVWK